MLDHRARRGLPILGPDVGVLEDRLGLGVGLVAAGATLLDAEVVGPAIGAVVSHARSVPRAGPGNAAAIVRRGRTLNGMAGKVPPKANEKKVGKSLKEKRAAKQAKKGK